jgi:hypothetical protein
VAIAEGEGKARIQREAEAQNWRKSHRRIDMADHGAADVLIDVPTNVIKILPPP